MYYGVLSTLEDSNTARTRDSTYTASKRVKVEASGYSNRLEDEAQYTGSNTWYKWVEKDNTIPLFLIRTKLQAHESNKLYSASLRVSLCYACHLPVLLEQTHSPDFLTFLLHHYWRNKNINCSRQIK